MTCRNDFVVSQETSVSEFDSLESKLKTYEDIIAYQNDTTQRVDRVKVEHITNFLNRIFQSGYVNYNKYPGIRARIVTANGNLGDINVAEVSTFIVDKGYTEDGLISILINNLPPLSGNVDPTKPYVLNDNTNQVLDNLEDFFDRNVTAATTGDFCSAFANAFAKLSTLYALASSTVKKISELKNGVTTFLKTFDANVKKIIDEVKKRIKNEIAEVKKTIARIKNIPNELVKRGTAIANDIEERMSEPKIQKLKDRIEETISKMGGQFEKLTPESIAYIMFRLCQMSQSVQEFLRNPIDNYKKFVREAQDTKTAVDNEFKRMQYARYSNGGVNLDRDQAFDIKQQAYTNQANGVGQDSRNGGQTSSIPAVVGKATSETITESNTFEVVRSGDRFSSVSNKYFRLSERAMNVGVDHNKSYLYPDTCGWSSIRPELWAKAALLSERMGVQFTINSAYRTPEKNASVGGAKQSFHMRGMALDISRSGMDPVEFIKHASILGFGGIGFYNSFIHVDIRTYKATWINGNASQEVRNALNIHKFPEKYGYFKDNHEPKTTPSKTSEFSIDAIRNILNEA